MKIKMKSQLKPLPLEIPRDIISHNLEVRRNFNYGQDDQHEPPSNELRCDTIKLISSACAPAKESSVYTPCASKCHSIHGQGPTDTGQTAD